MAVMKERSIKICHAIPWSNEKLACRWIGTWLDYSYEVHRKFSTLSKGVYVRWSIRWSVRRFVSK